MTGGISSPHFQSRVLKKVEFRTEPGTGKNACATENLHIGLFPNFHGPGVELNFDSERLQFATKFHSLLVGRDYGLTGSSFPGEDEDGCRYVFAVWRTLQLGLIGQEFLLGLLGTEEDLAFQKLQVFSSEGRQI